MNKALVTGALLQDLGEDSLIEPWSSRIRPETEWDCLDPLSVNYALLAPFFLLSSKQYVLPISLFKKQIRIYDYHLLSTMLNTSYISFYLIFPNILCSRNYLTDQETEIQGHSEVGWSKIQTPMGPFYGPLAPIHN